MSQQILGLFRWTLWMPLRDSWRGTTIPTIPGLYRIRRAGRDDLDYIGQTGDGTMTLKARLGMLRGVYDTDIPYRDPHTGAPALWALQHGTGCSFEVSVTPIDGTTRWRKGLEALAISLYRQDRGASPTIEFGRMPQGYAISSNRSMGRRGGLTTVRAPNHEPGIGPIGPLDGDVTRPTWCGHGWSPWLVRDTLRTSVSPIARGLYRLRLPGESSLLYIGQGLMATRLLDHYRKAGNPKYA